MKRALIAVDGQGMKHGVREMLEGAGFIVTGEAGSGAELIALYEKLKPEILAVNISVTSTDLMEALSEVKKRDAELKIIILSDKGGDSEVREALQAGAVAYIINH